MLARTVSSATRQLAAENGSQTTEYALIMVVTDNKLRPYDGLRCS
jgi:hypothetical protein